MASKAHEQQCIDFGPALPAWAVCDKTHLKSRDRVLCCVSPSSCCVSPSSCLSLETLQFGVIKIALNRHPSANKIIGRCSSVGMLTRLRTLLLGFQFPEATRNFSLNQNAYTGSEPHPAVCLLCIGVLGGKAAGTGSWSYTPHIVSRLRMSGAIVHLCLPYMPL